MRKHLSSTKSAKDKDHLVDLDDLALAMHADATFMSDEEYAAAAARLAKRKQIMEPQPKLRPTKFGTFVAGLWAGAAILAVIAFVTQVSGPLAGIMLTIGIVLMLCVIGANIEGVDE